MKKVLIITLVLVAVAVVVLYVQKNCGEKEQEEHMEFFDLRMNNLGNMKKQIAKSKRWHITGNVTKEIDGWPVVLYCSSSKDGDTWIRFTADKDGNVWMMTFLFLIRQDVTDMDSVYEKLMTEFCTQVNAYDLKLAKENRWVELDRNGKEKGIVMMDSDGSDMIEVTCIDMKNEAKAGVNKYSAVE